VKTHLLLTRYSPARVLKGEMLSYKDVIDLLGIDFIGAIPESHLVLQSSNSGVPVIFDPTNEAAQAYTDVIHRFLGEDRPQRFLEPPKRGFFSRMFGQSNPAPLAAVG
jgi:septum site-determining protein MinD